MAWYEKAVFYHIYPLGLLNAPKQNEGAQLCERLQLLEDWIPHIKELGCTAIYLGPVFESATHGYDTSDYKTVDKRLGTNNTLKHFIEACHSADIRVILDGVFNHTGRGFFAFQDIKQHRESSPYTSWYKNINFWGNTEYNDGFSYENWGGHNLLVKLNQHNPEVISYICDVIRFWVSEFDIDGIRLDAADVLDFEFMKALRRVSNEVKPEFWLMGEVIHGEYCRWVNPDIFHSVTNYHLHKALYSGHNDHNYFEIAHTVKRLNDQLQGHASSLYTFVDNHDVDRIASKVTNKAHLIPIYYLLYTLPGIPSLYYGSEFALEGRKINGSDDPLRPALDLKSLTEEINDDFLLGLIRKLSTAKAEHDSLTYGQYIELLLTNRQYAFGRFTQTGGCITAVNNDDSPARIVVPLKGHGSNVVDLFTNQQILCENDNAIIELKANSGRLLWIKG
ncbi:alpha-amylase family glycosyl hydrolase [Anaeromicropila populeti]|uniref:Glycosidase n=1 Tax=Anaeromicropila populeti TaxID=37658 RepID=A0A1I6LC83_9FIRM|nr:alpha-amylase family glycosyl hydrolase [Anaeromicropila populeti]SFS01044.1 Glycosidase [Anaeromicropila populeti]